MWNTPADTATTRWLAKRRPLLGQQLALLVAVAQHAKGSTAPAPEGAVGGDGEAVTISSRDSDDALASKGLELLGQQLVLLVAVATAPAPDGAVGGGGEAVAASNRRGDDALSSKGLELLGLPLLLRVAVAQLAPGYMAPAPDAAVGGQGGYYSPADTLTARSPPSGEGRRVGLLSRVTPSPWPRRHGM